MFERISVGVASAVGVAALMLGATASPAFAETRATGGTTGNDTTTWITGQYEYGQNAGDDFGFDNNSGATIDMRWRRCDAPYTNGAAVLNIRPIDGRRAIGINFKQGACIVSQYRAYQGADMNRSFSGVMTWNTNFA